MELSDSLHMKAADAAAIGQRGVDPLVLMETAAGFVAEAAASYLGERRRAAVFCGPGNNGGDGVAAARILMKKYGAAVRVFLVGRREKMTGDCREMEKRLEAAGGRLEDFSPEDGTLPGLLRETDVLIDALFGVGLSRDLAGDPLAAVKLMNASGKPVVSADIPSGVSADTGRVLGDAVRAARTVTFSMAKPGHFAEPGCVYTGELLVRDIGIPADLLEGAGCGVYAIRGEDLRLPRRDRLSHKGDHGKLLIVGGSVGYTGAPSLCARAAVRSGAGLVYLGVPADIYEITAVKNDEAMPFPLRSNERGQASAAAWDAVGERLVACGVCVIGPGLGRGEDTLSLVRTVISRAQCPLVLDADALWAAAADPTVLDSAADLLVLTPHEGEFARLLGRPVRDRLEDARQFAAKHDCCVVLKGHRTICAFPDGRAYIIDVGNPGMAKGGTGDVLAGVIGAMLGQMTAARAIVTACWLHARAGDIGAGLFGEYALTASDIIDCLYRAQREIQ